MPINKELKKKVIEDWRNAFPHLTSYAQNKLYKIAGPVIIGVELIKLPYTEEYRPHFVLYTLCGNDKGNDLKSCLSYPVLLMEYYNNKGLQYSIPYERHSLFFLDVLESMKKQTPLLFESNISLGKIISLIDDYCQKSHLRWSPQSYLQAMAQEAKLRIALYVMDAEAQTILEQLNRRSWDVTHFKLCKVDVNEWLHSLKRLLSDKAAFMKQVEANQEDKKIAKLKRSEITID